MPGCAPRNSRNEASGSARQAAEKPSSIFGPALNSKAGAKLNPETAAGPPVVVLDTNTVLDWLVFADPRVQALAQAVEGGQLCWVACAPMRQELGHMLAHTSLARWSPDAAAALVLFDRLAVPRDTPTINPAIGLRCSDRDDQVFLDLALAERALWLLTHDRALLKLARRAARHGLRIVSV